MATLEQRLDKLFEDAGIRDAGVGVDQTEDERIARLAAEIRSGTGRTLDEIAAAIGRIGELRGELRQAFTEANIRDFSTADETEGRRLTRLANEAALSTGRTFEEIVAAIGRLPADTVDPSTGVTDVAPVDVGSSTIPQGGRLVRVRNPEGSDVRFLYFVTYDWRGVTFAFEVGDPARFKELFGSTDNFESFQTLNQGQFDDQGFVLGGSIDSELGATESIGSRIERETRALGLEDLPSWLSGSPDALAVVAEAARQQWSSGRLWKELSTTDTFQNRWGAVLPLYRQEGVTIAEAVREIEADERALREALRPFSSGTDAMNVEFLHGLLNEGWTPGFVAQVLEVSESFLRDPESLTTANLILEASGLEALDEVGFVNALAGFGPQETIEALNTATAARALDEAGIDLADDDVGLIMDLVDQSDRLLTADAWKGLAQELSLNLVRFNTELDQEKLGVERDDLVAAAFGQESPTGKSSGEVLSMLARFERDRRAAGAGFDQTTGFINQQGRLQIQGQSGL